jgi:hypothetical protein
MRKVAFKDIDDKTKKLMLCQTKEGVYLFGYYSLQDNSANWECFFSTIEDANECCEEEYNIKDEDWITISDQPEHCQQDFIIPTMVKGRDVGKPEYGHLQSFINGKWIDYTIPEKYMSFDGLTGNERLFISGLTFEFENAIINDKAKATKILNALNFDKPSIEKIIG